MSRIAVLGLELESNRFAPVTTEADFRTFGLYTGEALRAELVSGPVAAFLDELGRRRRFELVPVLWGDGRAGGPCDHDFFNWAVAAIEHGLRKAGPIDGVLVCGHGAGLTTRCDDLDGAYFAAVRAIVGPKVPIVAVLDLHANVSAEMVRAVDVQIGYRTNPHVDVAERYAEAAGVLDRCLQGGRPFAAFVRLPLVTPQVTQLTRPADPLGELFARAAARLDQRVFSVSLFPGFAFGDTLYNGFCALAHAWDEQAEADAAALELAEAVWSERHRFVPRLIGIDDAVRRVRERGRGDGPLVLADVADNPGGGGRGNTTAILEAFVAAGVSDVQFGVHHDPLLVAEAAGHGAGTWFEACFNRAPAAGSPPFRAMARVARLVEGRFTGRHGMARGQRVDLGRGCLLEIKGTRVALASHRQQVLGPDYLEHFGLKPEAASGIVVKSRGHFRAGFARLAGDTQIFEIDGPGLAPARLDRVAWTRLPRPVFPLDPDATWAPAITGRGR